MPCLRNDAFPVSRSPDRSRRGGRGAGCKPGQREQRGGRMLDFPCFDSPFLSCKGEIDQRRSSPRLPPSAPTFACLGRPGRAGSQDRFPWSGRYGMGPGRQVIPASPTLSRLSNASYGCDANPLSVAIGDYDRNWPLIDGEVAIDGAAPSLRLAPEEIFFRVRMWSLTSANCPVGFASRPRAVTVPISAFPLSRGRSGIPQSSAPIAASRVRRI